MPPHLADLQGTVINAIDIVYSIGGFIFLALMFVIGFQWMISRDEEKKITELKDQLKRWFIGIILFFLSATFVKTIYDGLGVVDCNRCPVTPGFNLVKNQPCLSPKPLTCPTP